MPRRLKVLFLTKYPLSGASSRYRVYQYLPFLATEGIDATVLPFYTDAEYQIIFDAGGRLSRTWVALKAICRRIWQLRRWSEYDLLYLQRELLPVGPPWLERFLRREGAAMIFDYDDALFIHKDSTVSELVSRVRNPERIIQIFGLVDAVVAGNTFLAEQARAHCASTHVVEVAEDLERITPRPPHEEDSAVTLGWFGSRSTEKYLHMITPALQAFFRAFPHARLVVVGGRNYRADGISVEHKTWSLDSECELLHHFDIGLMPLPDEPWSLGKCGGKARTYMAAGVPAVCTGIGYNRELIHHGETGMLVNTNEEWTSALTKLAENPRQRQAIAEAARADVQQRFSQRFIASQLASVIREVVDQH